MQAGLGKEGAVMAVRVCLALLNYHPIEISRLYSKKKVQGIFTNLSQVS